MSIARPLSNIANVERTQPSNKATKELVLKRTAARNVAGSTQIFECLACGSDNLVAALDLNDQPLANSFKSNVDESENFYPLAVNLCPKCHHLQLTHAVDPSIIYKHYLYVSGTSQTYLDYMKWYAEFVSETLCGHKGRNTASKFSVLDIGCNDGSQLDAFKDAGALTFGIDPAANLYDTSTGKGHTVVLDFWGPHSVGTVQERLPTGKVDVITSQNAFAHIPDPCTYLKLASTIMHDDSLVFISTSQSDMVLRGEFDTIYHEHISFYNAKSMACLAERAGMHLIDAVKTPIHGTSYVFILGKRPQRSRLANILAIERAQGLDATKTYIDWAAKTMQVRDNVKSILESHRQNGYILGGYGAAAKGNTLLNFCNVKLDFIVDDNKLKQGTFSPGVGSPVVPVEHLQTLAPSQNVLFVPLAWNYFDDIRTKILTQREHRDDKFLRYFPCVEIVGGVNA